MMEEDHDKILSLLARFFATSAIGEGLCLVGGSRYRYLDGSGRSSRDLDYHVGRGDPLTRAEAIGKFLTERAIPEVRRLVGYDGRVSRENHPGAEPLATMALIRVAFWRHEPTKRRIETSVDLIQLPLADPPEPRLVDGRVYLTISDADMIEAKLIALLNRVFIAPRDLFDIHQFQGALSVDTATRLDRKLAGLGLDEAKVRRQWSRLRRQERYLAKALDDLLETGVDQEVAEGLRRAGGGSAMYTRVAERLEEIINRLQKDHVGEGA